VSKSESASTVQSHASDSFSLCVGRAQNRLFVASELEHDLRSTHAPCLHGNQNEHTPEVGRTRSKTRGFIELNESNSLFRRSMASGKTVIVLVGVAQEFPKNSGLTHVHCKREIRFSYEAPTQLEAFMPFFSVRTGRQLPGGRKRVPRLLCLFRFFLLFLRFG
jgi:hypothetical protein